MYLPATVCAGHKRDLEDDGWPACLADVNFTGPVIDGNNTTSSIIIKEVRPLRVGQNAASPHSSEARTQKDNEALGRRTLPETARAFRQRGRRISSLFFAVMESACQGKEKGRTKNKRIDRMTRGTVCRWIHGLMPHTCSGVYGYMERDNQCPTPQVNSVLPLSTSREAYSYKSLVARVISNKQVDKHTEEKANP
jgi:hypothetical protein